MGFRKGELSHDRFLDGRVELYQPRAGFRAGSDTVFLAASVPVRAGQSVLELGCGVGVGLLCLAQRVPELCLTGVEMQANYAELARSNAAGAGIDLHVENANLAELPDSVRGRSFDHVFANPPYYQRANGNSADDIGRELSLAGDTPLAEWIDVGTRRLKPGGILTLIQKADRLPDVLGAMDGRLGDVRVKPLLPRNGKPAEVVIVAARKGARAPFRLLAPLVLHKGARHERDGDSYTDAAKAILRGCEALELGN